MAERPELLQLLTLSQFQLFPEETHPLLLTESNFTVVHRVSALKWHLCFTDPVKVSWGAQPQVLQTGTRVCRLWVSETRKMKAVRVRPGIPLLQGREGTVEKRGLGPRSTRYAPYTGDRRKAVAPRIWTKKGKQI